MENEKKTPWRMPERLEPYRRYFQVPEGHTLESMLNRVGPIETGSFLDRERTKLSVQLSLLVRLYNVGCLVLPFHHRPGYDPNSGFEAQDEPEGRKP